jgi:hypothetical protein
MSGAGAKTAYGASAFQMSPLSPLPLPVPLTGGCQFIAGDPLVELKAGRDPHCGKTRRDGSSYCAAHHRRCWVKGRKGLG